MIEIIAGLALADGELSFTASRSGGPGGQNVNKVATRVTLTFDLASSPSLTDEQRRLLRARLATRISRDGVLRVVSQRHRTQGANRVAAVERFVELLRAALVAESTRVATRPTHTSQQRRMARKKRHALAKQERRRVLAEE